MCMTELNVEDEAEAPPEAVARELAKLSPLAYDQRREEEAKQLGVRPATLDKVVTKLRAGAAPPAAGRGLAWRPRRRRAAAGVGRCKAADVALSIDDDATVHDGH